MTLNKCTGKRVRFKTNSTPDSQSSTTDSDSDSDEEQDKPTNGLIPDITVQEPTPETESVIKQAVTAEQIPITKPENPNCGKIISECYVRPWCTVGGVQCNWVVLPLYNT